MKKLILSAIIILLSLTVFSQTVTKSTTNDSTVTIPKSVARELAKDVIRGDSAKAELSVCKINSNLLIANLGAKDSIIASKENVISLHVLAEKNLNGIIDTKNLEKVNLQNEVTTLNGDLKKANQKLVKRTVIGSAIIAGLTYFILKK